MENITFDQMSSAIDHAQSILSRAKSFVNKMASFIVRDGNMRQIDSWTLNKMKKELRNWDMVKKEWKK